MNGSGNARKIVMLVDDNEANLAIGKDMLKDVYKVYPVPSGEIMFDLLEDVRPDIILLDILMPGMDGYEAIKRLKKSRQWADIPVVLLTAKSDESSEYVGLSLGAMDYVSKPFYAPLLLKRIENLLMAQAQMNQLRGYGEGLPGQAEANISQINSLQNAVLNTISGLVEFKEDETDGHIIRTRKYLKILVDQMLLDGVYIDEVGAWDMNFVLSSSQLHDVGNIAISDVILKKPGALTPEEFVVMMSHVEEGIKAVQKIEESTGDDAFMRHVRLIVGSHHEKWDGSGYPNGLRGTEIPLEGRLMAIADVYDALISKRPYKKPLTAEEASAIIKEGSAKHFDPALVDVFSKVEDKFADVVKNSMHI